MKIGRAYKLAAFAASHKAKAISLLEIGDHDGAKKEEIAYLVQVESIPSKFRHEIARFLDALLQVKLSATAEAKPPGIPTSRQSGPVEEKVKRTAT